MAHALRCTWCEKDDGTLVAAAWCRLVKQTRKTTYELGERFPSGVTFCFAATSLNTTGALGDVVREVADADLRSAEAGVCVAGARVGKVDWGLEPGSDGGGAGGAATDATAVDMAKIVGEW